MTVEKLERLMENSVSLKNELRSLLVEVPEWKEDVFGVYLDDAKDKDDPKRLMVVAKSDHPVCQEWLRQMCESADGECLYMVSKIGPNAAVTFDTTDELLKSKLTREIRASILRELFLNFAKYSERGWVSRIEAPEGSSALIKAAFDQCKIWNVRRQLLSDLECTKGLMPSSEEMFRQFLQRGEGGGKAVAVPLNLWNDCADAFLSASAKARVEIQKSRGAQ